MVNKNKDGLSTYLPQIINNTPGSLYWKDLEGRYLGCNKFMLKTAGFKNLSDIVGKTDFELWPENAQHVHENDQEVIKTKKVKFLKETVKLPGEQIMYFTGVKMPLYDADQNVIGIVGNSLDITTLEKTKIELELSKKKAVEAETVKDQFIKNMSHDIRTPFLGVIQLTEDLHNRETDPTKKMELGLILESNQRIFALLSKVMEAIRLETTEHPTHTNYSYFSLTTLLNEIKTMMAPLVQQKKLLFDIQIAPGIPAQIFGDHFRLQSILINLTSNAIKFTKTGFVRISIDCLDKTTEQIHLCFKISDSGIGIPSNQQDFIFEKFARVVPSYKGLYEGIGFGLSIVKRFINDLQGTIKVISEENKGSTFICTLPFQLTETENTTFETNSL